MSETSAASRVTLSPEYYNYKFLFSAPCDVLSEPLLRFAGLMANKQFVIFFTIFKDFSLTILKDISFINGINVVNIKREMFAYT